MPYGQLKPEGYIGSIRLVRAACHRLIFAVSVQLVPARDKRYQEKLSGATPWVIPTRQTH